MKPDLSELTRLANIGSTSARWLYEIGVRTRKDLERMGAVMAYKIIQHRQRGANLNLLYALEGALLDEHWNALSPEHKARLRAEAAEPLQVDAGRPEGSA